MMYHFFASRSASSATRQMLCRLRSPTVRARDGVTSGSRNRAHGLQWQAFQSPSSSAKASAPILTVGRLAQSGGGAGTEKEGSSHD